MFSFVHTADLHLDSLYPNSYIESENNSFMTEDAFKNLRYIVEYAVTQDVDMFFISGDIFNRPSVPKRIISNFIFSISPLIENGIETFIISGQHDTASDGSTPLTVVKSTLSDWFKRKSCIHIYNNLETGRFCYGNDVKIYCIPFSNKMQRSIKNLRRNPFSKKKFNILVTHSPFVGSKVGVNNFELLDGLDYDTVRAFDYVAAGDIHKPQIIGNIHYPGSIIPLNFGERKDDKTFLHFTRGQKVVAIALPYVRKFIKMTVRNKERFDKILYKNYSSKLEDSIVGINFYIGGELTLDDSFVLERKLIESDRVKNVVVDIKNVSKNIKVSGENISFGIDFDSAFEELLNTSEIPEGIEETEIRSYVKGLLDEKAK